ncbi:MAG TPA: pyridoxal-dependent decarboxylase [Acidobacteriota bacterium]|nr:pyridoxal-dependent decarboxylase [Acidobacteriota bacterium]
MGSDIEDSKPAQLGEIDLENFRTCGYQIIDWIAEYLAHPEKFPVLPDVKPGAIRSQLPDVPPEHPESLSAIFEDVRTIIAPGLTHWNHPAFMAYFGTTGSVPGILGELLAAAFNVNAMLWKTSPAATELEELVLDWLRQMIGLPEGFSGIIYDTASISTMHAIAAAREAVPGLNSRELGLSGRPDAPRLRLYASEQAHSSVEKAAITLGIGQAGVRKIPVDEKFRMKSRALEQAIIEDRNGGWTPFCVVATVGTTSTTSVDPVDAIADICGKYGLWLHVDAAYGGAAAILPEKRWIMEGCDRADSLVVNPHKWIFTPSDLSAFFTQRLDVLKKAFSLVPEYLKTEDDQSARNLMDYGVQLGRRFRALKLWMIIRTYGWRGIEDRIREHIRLAQLFRDWVKEDPAFELLAPVLFSTVCFRALPARPGQDPDQLNQNLLNAVNASGEVFLSHTRLHDRFAIRMAIGNIRTDERVVRQTWELLKKHLAALL